MRANEKNSETLKKMQQQFLKADKKADEISVMTEPGFNQCHKQVIAPAIL